MSSSWEPLRAFILERDEFVCAYCLEGQSNHVDHIIPRSKGGSDDPSNLVTACKSCNSAKGARTPWEWSIRSRMFLPPWWTKECRP